MILKLFLYQTLNSIFTLTLKKKICNTYFSNNPKQPLQIWKLLLGAFCSTACEQPSKALQAPPSSPHLLVPREERRRRRDEFSAFPHLQRQHKTQDLKWTPEFDLNVHQEYLLHFKETYLSMSIFLFIYTKKPSWLILTFTDEPLHPLH